MCDTIHKGIVMQECLFFHVSFSQEWILTKRSDDVLPAEWIINALKDRYNLSHIKTKLTECEGLVDLQDEVKLHEVISSLLCNRYNVTKESNAFLVSVEKQNVANATKDDINAEKLDSESNFGMRTSAKDIINGLVGTLEFKALAKEVIDITDSLKKNNMVDSFISRSYLVSINDGYGITTYLKLFSDLIKELGLFEFTSRTEVAEVKLSPPDLKQGLEGAFSSALSYFQGRNVGRIVCIDISEWMSKLNDKEFREFLLTIEKNNGSNIVFFRIPFVETNIVKQVESALNDVLFIKSISIPPFSNDKLIQCAKGLIQQKDFNIESGAWEIINERIALEKSDGRFYGINSIKKIIKEMFYSKLLYNVRHDVDDRIIKKNDILSLTNGTICNSKSGYEQLYDLIGIEPIIEKVKEIVAQIETALSNDSIDTPCIHMRFVGNPGTGKTTVARIIGIILKERGILRNGNFFEYSGRDLCGRFVGETASKTAAICRDAYGSVLFIDEAYSLYRDEGLSNADYGREAIDTLVAEMENHRFDLMVIMAGYPDDMDKLMDGNAGLKSRMPYLIEFPNYTRAQLADIYMSMVNKGFTYDDDFMNAVNSYFSSLSDEILQAKDFSNARFVRNLFERTWGKAALRCQLDRTACDVLTVEDLALATSDKEFHNIMEHKRRTIGFN